MMPQAAVQEAVQQNEKELLRTAAYARLSVENGGHETEDSLHTQILQIHNYIRENPELITFIWAMGGENMEFDDMDNIATTDLR